MLKLDDHLCFKLYVASRLVIRGYADLLAPLNLTYPKYLVLLALSEADGQTVGSLAQRLNLDFGTLSPLLKSLGQSGFIDRRRPPDDERVVANYLTRTGRATAKKALTVVDRIFCESDMTHAELTHMRDLIDEYIQRCQRIVDGRPSTTRGKNP